MDEIGLLKQKIIKKIIGKEIPFYSKKKCQKFFYIKSNMSVIQAPEEGSDPNRWKFYSEHYNWNSIGVFYNPFNCLRFANFSYNCDFSSRILIAYVMCEDDINNVEISILSDNKDLIKNYKKYVDSEVDKDDLNVNLNFNLKYPGSLDVACSFFKELMEVEKQKVR